MNNWPSLLKRFEAAVARTRADEARFERAERARSELHAWYVDAEFSILNELYRLLSTRTQELSQRGVEVAVTRERSQRLPIQRQYSSRAIGLRFGRSEMVVYSALLAGGPLWIHWGWLMRGRRPHCPRVLSAPGVRVRRSPLGQMALLRAAGQPGEAAWELEDIARTVLGMLADAAQLPRDWSAGVASCVLGLGSIGPWCRAP